MGFRARGVYQMIDLDERVNLVVLFWVWERRCDGGRRKRGAARVFMGRERYW